MKGKIEAAANIIVIVIAVAVGSLFLKDRLSPPATELEAVEAGDKLPNLVGWDWGSHEHCHQGVATSDRVPSFTGDAVDSPNFSRAHAYIGESI
jgi:hypothetical protein